MSPQSAIVIPTEEELTEIAKVSLQVPDKHIRFFVQSVQVIAHTLLGFQKRGIPLNKGIKRTRTALRATIKNLHNAKTAFSSEEDLIRYFSDEDLSGDLATLFSIPGDGSIDRAVQWILSGRTRV